MSDQQVLDPENFPDQLQLPLSPVRPFLKWAGGKARLAASIRHLVPRSYKNYIEPFLGGGSIFFSLSPKTAILSDSNEELINCYKIVKGNPDALIRSLADLAEMSFDETTYYKIRSRDFPSHLTIENATRFIYLNHTAFNGLFRVNRAGKFNVPFGGYKKLSLPSPELIFNCSRVLARAELMTGDFSHILRKYAKAGDFAYLDPPYPPVGKYSDFNRYTKDFFSEEGHQRLCDEVNRLDNIGCKFVLSYPDNGLVRKLYDGRKFQIVEVSAPRYINCKGDKRGGVPELLISNTQLPS